MDGQQAPELEVLDHRELLQALRKEEPGCEAFIASCIPRDPDEHEVSY